MHIILTCVQCGWFRHDNAILCFCLVTLVLRLNLHHPGRDTEGRSYKYWCTNIFLLITMHTLSFHLHTYVRPNFISRFLLGPVRDQARVTVLGCVTTVRHLVLCGMCTQNVAVFAYSMFVLLHCAASRQHTTHTITNSYILKYTTLNFHYYLLYIYIYIHSSVLTASSTEIKNKCSYYSTANTFRAVNWKHFFISLQLS
jgi:hypothetical protein